MYRHLRIEPSALSKHIGRLNQTFCFFSPSFLFCSSCSENVPETVAVGGCTQQQQPVALPFGFERVILRTTQVIEQHLLVCAKLMIALQETDRKL